MRAKTRWRAALALGIVIGLAGCGGSPAVERAPEPSRPGPGQPLVTWGDPPATLIRSA